MTIGMLHGDNGMLPSGHFLHNELENHHLVREFSHE